MCLDNGSMVNTYLADNGVFKANHFVQHICENNQRICYCGVNENHESSVAELSICMVSEMYYAMMLHPSLLWKNIIGSKLWPMVTSYSTYIFNHNPNVEDIAPDDLFTGTKPPRQNIKYIYVWDCPVYV